MNDRWMVGPSAEVGAFERTVFGRKRMGRSSLMSRHPSEDVQKAVGFVSLSLGRGNS